ncbi:DUF2169 family type VI secretion system accessory protein [Gynuella sunshinyii]|uniref:DUF2169 domain-containing protein n=1 Tax=Gynuella sunshinyii YC6258 TaxID=1445510 RepID=A0A0C5VTK8_9GAMM|nr:DUF2169 domain-containing protein [Gynuella sunshinyii]AJQ97521.1 hypothetical protein YC6258_05493 [Gynuella sunshinyii YC6258]
MKKTLKIVKPMTLGLLYKPYSIARDHFLSVSSLAFFNLSEQPVLLPEHRQWAKVSQSLGTGRILDEAMPKTHGEVLLAGHAYPHASKPVTHMQVRLQIAQVDKTLAVSGDRHWSLGWLPLIRQSRAKPITQVPLDYSRAYGGEKYALNPEGCGDERLLSLLFGQQANHGRLPNLSYPGEQLTLGRRPQQPAGFGALGQNWSQRRKKAGCYNKRWLQHEYPGFPSSLDQEFFNTAAKDQWIDGYFSGGEAYQLDNLHPHQACLKGILPTIVPKAFVQPQTQSLIEVALHWDTLWLFPDHDLGLLIAHGSMPISDSDALDIDAIMLAWEHPQRSKTHQHYEQVLALRSDPQTAVMHAFNETQLTGDTPPSAAPVDAKPVSALLTQLSQQLPVSDAQLADAAAEVESVPGLSQAQIDAGQFDLTEIMTAAKTKADALNQEREQALKQLADMIKLPDDEAQPTLDPAQALERIYVPRQQLEQLTQLADSCTDAAQRQQILDSVPLIVRQQRQSRKLAAESDCQPISDRATVALAQWLNKARQQSLPLNGLCLAGIRLNNVDLSGLDLRDIVWDLAEFTDCCFDGSDLSGSCFIQARFQRCTFIDSRLQETNWSHAELHEVTLTRSHLQQSQWNHSVANDCRFDHSVFDQAMMLEADFRSSDFASATIRQVNWVKCHLQNSRWQAIEGEQSSWLECELQQADFTRASLTQCAWLNARATAVVFDQARLSRFLVSGESILNQASFNQCEGDQTGWRYSDLSDACFDHCYFRESDFGMTELQRCSFRSAFLQRCLLMSADASESDFTDSNWYQSLARKMILRQAIMQGVQLHGVELAGVDWQDCRIRDCEPAIRRKAA